MNAQAIQFDDNDLLGLEPSKLNLTQLEESFAQAYVYHGKISEAYREIYDVPPDRHLTPTERVRGSSLFHSKKIQSRIRELNAQAAQLAVVSKSRVLEELAKVAFFDVRKLYDAKGNIIPVQNLDDETAAALNAVDVNFFKDKDGNLTGEGVIKVKMADKLKALDSLGKEFELFREKIEHTGKDGKDLIPQVEYSDTDVARRVAFLLTQGLREQASG